MIFKKYKGCYNVIIRKLRFRFLKVCVIKNESYKNSEEIVIFLKDILYILYVCGREGICR